MSLVYAPEEAQPFNSDQRRISFAVSAADQPQASAELIRDETQKASDWKRPYAPLLRRLVLNRLSQLNDGQLMIRDPLGENRFGTTPGSGAAPAIHVHSLDFYRRVALGGGLSAAESYIRGDWDATNLTEVMRVLARNIEVLAGMERGGASLRRPLRVAMNWLRRNTRTGSCRNISAHYDLSNDFFALMLDPTMTYSSGVFKAADSTMEEASIEKYDLVCRKLRLSPADHVLEIGTGWGGFAEHAATHYGCRITTTTISEQQHTFAANRFRKAGLEQQIRLLKQDYRDLSGQFTKLASIEMIEAVGQRYLPEYFAKCSQLLVPDGLMCLQAILIPDHRYERYRRSVDFIQRYIFHGGFLPSLGAIANCVGRKTDLRFVHVADFGLHYAETLNRWRNCFFQNIDAVKKLGFDDRFIRTWHYYLCYCEAGFRERQIGVSQLLLSKPGCRLSFDP